MKKDIDKKKKRITEVVLNSRTLINKFLILDLLYNNHLDGYIYDLNEDKIYITVPTIIKKKYLTGYEQFLCILDNFIIYFLNIFNNVELSYTVLPLCIKNDKNNVLLTKKYFYDNSYIKYFNTEFNTMIVSNFYNNCLILREYLVDFFKMVDIDIENINIDNRDDMEKIIRLLEEVCFVNRNRYGIMALFEKINDANYKMFLMQYELLFSIYKKNIKFIRKYHKFRDDNDMYIPI